MRDFHPDTTAEQIAGIRRRVRVTRAFFASLDDEQRLAALAKLVETRRRALGIHHTTPQEAL